MKLNIGSGHKRFEGFTNLDNDPEVNPDLLIELDNINVCIPLDDNSVSEIKSHHFFEHVGSGFIPLMKELYRVAEHGCILDIVVPHHFHDVFYGDPTHVRPITVAGMNMFSKSWGREVLRVSNSSNGIALRYDIDWEMVHFEFKYDSFYDGLMDNVKKAKEEGTLSEQDWFQFQRLMREANNVASETCIKMVAIKA
jgi:hypothetical protein